MAITWLKGAKDLKAMSKGTCVISFLKVQTVMIVAAVMTQGVKLRV